LAFMTDEQMREACTTRTPERIRCEYCTTWNPYGAKSCSHCGAALPYSKPEFVQVNEYFDAAKYDALKRAHVQTQWIEQNEHVARTFRKGILIAVVVIIIIVMAIFAFVIFREADRQLAAYSSLNKLSGINTVEVFAGP